MANARCGNCELEFDSSYIHCTECPNFDVCLICFANGAEIGNHLRDHSYKIMHLTVRTVNVFETSKPWSLAEETMLLDAVEQYGFGNWEDVANHVKSRTLSECQEHYVTFYIHGNVGAISFPDENTRSNYRPIPDSTPPIKKEKSTSENNEGSGDASGDNASCDINGLSNGSPMPLVDLTAAEQKDLGYMMLRGDFEREYDNDAEAVISSIAINYDDEELDILFKLSQVDRYRSRLAERERRKRLACKFGLLSTNALFSNNNTSGKPKSQQTKKTKSSSSSSAGSKDDKDVIDRMRVFARFQTFHEHKQFCDNMQRVKDVRCHIKDLLRYRRNGLTKSNEVELFEEVKIKKERRADRSKKVANSLMNKRSMSSSSTLVSKKNECKLDIIIDDDDENPDDCDDESTKDMSSLPNYEQLSNSEKRLCSSLRLTPSNYITIKTSIIRESLQRQHGYPVKIRYPSYLDKTHRRKIINFLTNNGWICVT
ncbi:transcriptional adapter 2-beta-like [Octopus sinensis]|uniref:Transcriptional adapter n=1 Tax=Octopus sinensis TaxID=2607531 RepID=A0A6P7SRS5_9MOLL|nr:transcriptional adapter 2-beta-like [Octopus sinensis]XP_036361853.1 transcriptional adapter 2-beta-like [Octopus sinensis]